MSWLKEIAWNDDGLVPAIAQDAESGRVLMMAWMNAEALKETADSGYAVYWSRSRQKLWRKGEQSGHQQEVREISVDCDADVILLKVKQQAGIACHTGRQSCFYRVYNDEHWVTVEKVLKDPAHIYPKTDAGDA